MLEGQSCLISRSLPSSCEQESRLAYMTYHLLEITRTKRPSGVLAIEHDGIAVAAVLAKRAKSEDNHDAVPVDCQGGNQGYSDSSTLISSIGRDNSINCLARCSRSDYGSIASLSRNFRSLVRDGGLYRERRRLGIAEHWVYFSCNVQEWEAYDPYRERWMTLPRMPPNECFMCSDKESLAVGTELLVFGKEILSHIVLSYSILTNSWSRGVEMNAPRCLFGSASFGEKAIIAGGMDSFGSVLSSAELYNSETKSWITLPSMNKRRRMCSGVFMDGKFYVIGGPRVLGGGMIELHSWIPREGPLQWNMIGSKPSGNFVYNCAVMGC
ncbi:unnamed protein product [Triticum turgidum subsp. durum]|uniref:F-box domain-containing protein n=1 Tax=Triticum turgidum subsp. durum TaxID=4567 RepID=A0A9R0YUI6_TRITD|nr:unnamed protein product [Triticum turgidum subsp. durum]